MKTLKYIFMLVLVIGTTVSCFDDEALYELNDDGPVLAGFTESSTMVSNIADGTEFTVPVKVKLVGPSLSSLKDDITLTIAPDFEAMQALDESDTTKTAAVDGTHFRIDNPTIVLTAANNYIGIINVTMLTEGLITPLPETPILILKTESAAGNSGVIKNGKSLEITMNFACYSEFQGLYTVTHTRDDGKSFSRQEKIVKVGVEQYLTASVGIWGSSPFIDYGFIFDNACNDLSVSLQDLANAYSNDVWSHKLGNYNPETGVITIYYTIEFAAGNRTYTAVYVPVK